MSAAPWFWDLGIAVFPTTDKVPAVPKGTSQFDFRCTREQAASFPEFAVPLGGLFAVVDSDTAPAEAWNGAYLPDTPFKVTTGPYHDGSPGRGRHRYYRLAGDAPRFIRRDGLSIEFKSHRQYAVGPGSVRPDGVIYTPDPWSWLIVDVPYFPVADFLFDDGSCGSFSSTGQPLVLPEVVTESERHDTLHKIMRSMVARGVPFEGAIKACLLENQTRCHPPLSDLDELDRFLRRAYHQKDRPDFVRTPQTGWELAGSLCAVGLSVEATLAAVKSLDPTFDPNAPNG